MASDYPIIELVALFAALFLGTAALTGLLRRYALRRQILDVPNQRSSHETPTPRGGGLAVVIAVLIVLPVLYFTDALSVGAFVGLLSSGGLVSALGFLDDHGHVGARWRLLGHGLAAACLLMGIGGLPPVVLVWSVDLGWGGHVLALLFLVWSLNLFNFMDGIDGIAGVEAVTVCLGGGCLLVMSGAISLAILAGVLAFATLGFLVWNFPRAKIFMGDAGSGFIGLMLGGLVLLGARQEPELLWGWLILMGVFIVDATWTLLRRLVAGERVYQPHRSHAYQYAARRLGSHVAVTLWAGAINLFWLFPLAVLVVSGIMPALYGLLIAYLPLLVLALFFRAGDGVGQARMERR